MFHTNLLIFGASSSGIGALGFDGQTFIIQLITFILVLVVLKRFAFKPIINMLNQRHELIESGVKLGQDMQKERIELDEKVASELQKARTDADNIIASAQQEARKVVKDSEGAAKDKAKGILNEAQTQIQQETLKAKKDLEKELVGLISEATEAIIGEKVDAKKDAALIDRALHARKAI